MLRILITLITIASFCSANGQNGTEMLWNHLDANFSFEDSEGLRAQFSGGKIEATLENSTRFAYTTIPAPQGGWQLEQSAFVNAEVSNTSLNEIEIMVWVHADLGWDAVCEVVKLQPKETKQLSINLRDTFKDGTPKINPNRIDKIQFMLMRGKQGDSFAVHQLTKNGTATAWQMPKGRLQIPNLTEGKPEAGKRVKYICETAKGTQRYVALYLPIDWKPNKTYPIIVEFPGNNWFSHGCYSTGAPEGTAMGYGISKGKEAIWIGMPFVDDKNNSFVASGMGNPDLTAEFTVDVIEEIIAKFKGDKQNIFISGFSRGAIACGYIGFRNPEIASLWKGAIACQHYDGDGWNKIKMEGAQERIKQFKGSYFHIDNNEAQPKAMLKEAKINSTFTTSGLGAHATAMFLDNRASTEELRKWFKNQVKIKQ